MISPYNHQIEELMRLHYNRLSEREKRWYAAVEASKLGWGGTTYISHLLQLSRTTVTVAKKEMQAGLLQPQVPTAGRQRKTGGGRKKKYRKAG